MDSNQPATHAPEALLRRPPEIAIVGEINPDLILSGLPEELPEERELLATGFNFTLGSSSAILAHNLALLGTRVDFTSMVGPDVFGKLCCEWLAQAGVIIDRVISSSTGVGTGITVILAGESRRRILTYPGVMFEMGLEDLDLDALATAKHFHLSSLFLHRRLSPDIPWLFQEMKARGLTTSLDTNDDPENKWSGVLHDVLPFVDVLLCTESELDKISGRVDSEEHIAAKIATLVVKRGPRGASAYADGRRIDAPGLNVTMVDAVGAGDTFDAGFLHQWLRGASLNTCIAYGNLAGAFSVTRAGGVAAFRDADYRKHFFEKRWPPEWSGS